MRTLPPLLLALLISIWQWIPADAATPAETKSQRSVKTEGKGSDYQRMKSVRVMDREGWGEVGRVRLAYTIGLRDVEEWISASVVVNISEGLSSAGVLQGNLNATARNYQLTGQDLFVMRAPKGELDTQASLFSLIFGSIQVNPQYIAAVTQFYANIARINAQAAADRSRIWREAQAYIEKTRRDTYEYQQQVQNRISEQFSQAIRGVETYVDPRSNERVELSAGYQHAWSNGKGEYILSESGNFDPRVALKEDWTLMKKEQER